MPSSAPSVVGARSARIACLGRSAGRQIGTHPADTTRLSARGREHSPTALKDTRRTVLPISARDLRLWMGLADGATIAAWHRLAGDGSNRELRDIEEKELTMNIGVGTIVLILLVVIVVMMMRGRGRV